VSTDINYEELKKVVFKNGAAFFGVAEFSMLKDKTYELSENVMNKMTGVVVAGIRLAGGVLEDVVDHPTKLYQSHYRQVNYMLDRLALEVVGFIQEKKGSALPIPASVLVDWATQRAHFSHKHAAVEAGLGWIGRNNLFVHPEYGSQVRLVTVLTDLPLPYGKRNKSMSCGTCHACVITCPAEAIKENPAEFDHKKCYEKLDGFRKLYGISHHICGVCVKNCKGCV